MEEVSEEGWRSGRKAGGQGEIGGGQGGREKCQAAKEVREEGRGHCGRGGGQEQQKEGVKGPNKQDSVKYVGRGVWGNKR